MKHPAKFSPEILSELHHKMGLRLADGQTILDPFAGVGGIHLFYPQYNTVGVELEREWADQHPRNICGDSRTLEKLLPLHGIVTPVDAIVTSCAYGNRMSDNYSGDPKGSRRHTYRIDLGRELQDGNGAKYNWGAKYRRLHATVWSQCTNVLRPGGFFFLNISNHIRAHQEQAVVEWHLGTLFELGFFLDEVTSVETKRMRHGANHQARVPNEKIAILRKWD